MSKTYQALWNRLRAKYLIGYPRPVYLINGSYPYLYEGGYNWVVGFCPTMEQAESVVRVLKQELQKARRHLGLFNKLERLSRRQYNDAVDIYGWGTPKVLPYMNIHIGADDRLRDNIDLVFSSMTDQSIPFPYVHIMNNRKSSQGPITYDIQLVPNIS